jgi:hypothetical protein
MGRLMANETTRLSLADPAMYRICVQGVIGPSWSEDFAGFTISGQRLDDPSAMSCLQGRVQDQAELLGVLNRLYGLGLPLLSVQVIW